MSMEGKSTAMVLGSSSSAFEEQPRRRKRHINVPQLQEFPTAEEWPETYEQVFSRVYNLTSGLTLERRVQWARERIRSYYWSIEVCKKVNPHLLEVYKDILAQLTSTRT